MIRDDFAGPGGWDVALASLGRTDVIGVEFDAHACATARAAGHRREHADVRTMRRVKRYRDGLEGYIASPPCQTFSAAGKGAGRAALQHLLYALALVADGATPEQAIAAVHDEALDERSLLVLEPLLVIRDHRPLWVALEQVPTVLPVWQAYAGWLRAWGYSVATDALHAEQYGVPQTRRRAVLLAHRERAVQLPTPTHSRYYPRDRTRMDEGVLPWVPMAEALSWGATARPSMTVTGGGTAAGGAEPFGNAARQGLVAEPEACRWVLRNNNAGRAEDRSHPRTLDQPAATVSFGHNSAAVRWEPQAAVDGDTSWVEDRPSPTIVGSFAPDVVAAPGYRRPGDPPRQKTPGSVRVSVVEAGILQSFPADYPWQGTKTQQYQQVGNAIPPLLARAVLQELL